MTRGSTYPQPPAGAAFDAPHQPRRLGESGTSLNTPTPARRSVHALTGDPSSVRTARHHTIEFLQGSVPPPDPQFLTDALLVVSELVANAVTHAPGPCTLLLRDDENQLTITVRDTSVLPLTPRTPDHAGKTGGFGWHLLRRLADHMATEYSARGKSTTVTLPKTSPS